MVNHWTNERDGGFATAITIDYFDQLEDRLEDLNISRSEYAELLGISPGRVSQFLNAPFKENPEVKTLVQYIRPLGLKVAIVIYKDDDEENTMGPVLSGIFREAWEKQGKPRHFSPNSEKTVTEIRTFHPPTFEDTEVNSPSLESIQTMNVTSAKRKQATVQKGIAPEEGRSERRTLCRNLRK